MDVSISAQTLQICAAWAPYVLAVSGACSFFVAHVPPAASNPSTAIGKLWLGVYDVLNFAAQNVHFATNASDPHGKAQ